ncbi:hypothetical protein QBC38DRAFT_473578 [Podospora fimiseda]|uniref:Uncharacterized protein n=1 Tax=Podospora fimiseda TaxID=252190 RepID=A0AAN7BT83_9PEZI|nr:hypothetical protein QBC38DRAFT_473578 [Podospora fimiseda]
MRPSLYLLTAASGLAIALLSSSPSLMIDPHLDRLIQHEFRTGILAARQLSNLQAFTGALGGLGASAILNSGDPDRPFEVDGDTFIDFDTAANRACDNQKNRCAEAANNLKQFSVGDCDRQSETCKSEAAATTNRGFAPPESVLVSSNEQFDFFCDV